MAELGTRHNLQIDENERFPKQDKPKEIKTKTQL